jgi:hypothetical protein
MRESLKKGKLVPYQQQFLLFEENNETRVRIWNGASIAEKYELWKAMEVEQLHYEKFKIRLKHLHEREVKLKGKKEESEEEKESEEEEEEEEKMDSEFQMLNLKHMKEETLLSEMDAVAPGAGADRGPKGFKGMRRNDQYCGEGRNFASSIQLKYWRLLNQDEQYELWFEFFNPIDRVKLWNVLNFSKIHLIRLAQAKNDPKLAEQLKAIGPNYQLTPPLFKEWWTKITKDYEDCRENRFIHSGRYALTKCNIHLLLNLHSFSYGSRRKKST